MPQPRHDSLTWFLLLSCGLHLLFLGGHARTTEPVTLRHLGEPEVSVVLENAARVPNTPANAPRIALRSAQSAPAVPALPTAPTSDPREPPSILPPDEAAQRREPAIVAASGDTLRNQLLGELQTRLARYLKYPPLARERGWQGTVWLGLHVESDGRLENVRLERTSGYAVLDHSALNSLNRLGYLTDAVTWLNGRSVDMQLPVIYRLVEN